MENKKELYIGTVEAQSGGGFYQVKVDYDGIDRVIRCYRSGKMNKNHIRVIVGDKVKVWWEYPSTVGRIIERL
jgi:translation initiation factor IF-1